MALCAYWHDETFMMMMMMMTILDSLVIWVYTSS